MTNVQNIERPQLFKALEDYIILWSNVTVKYIDTIKAVIKKAVTPPDSKESNTSNSTIKPFATLGILNYEIDALLLSNSHLQEEIDELYEDFQNNDNTNASYCNKRNKRLRNFQTKKFNQDKLILSYINMRSLYDS